MLLRSSTAFAVILAATPALADAPRVLADTPPVHSIVSRVMAGVGEPDLLLPPGATPHSFSLRPSDAARLSNADIVIWTGEALTPWLEAPLATLAGNATHLELLETDGWTRLDMRDDEAFAHDDHDGHVGDEDHAHGDEHDHAHGDDHDDAHGDDHDDAHGDDHDEAHGDAHGEDNHDDAHDHAHEGTDPHAWLDPSVAAAWAGHIAAALATADPANAEIYHANAAEAQAEYAALANDVATRLSAISGRGYIVPHDAYQYFETRFDLPAAGTISLSDAATPGPARIADLRGRVADGGIVCVLTDPQTSPQWTAVLREGTTGVKTALADADGTGLTPGPDLYPAILTGMADALADCLG